MSKMPLFVRKAKALAKWQGKKFKQMRTAVEGEIADNKRQGASHFSLIKKGL